MLSSKSLEISQNSLNIYGNIFVNHTVCTPNTNIYIELTFENSYKVWTSSFKRPNPSISSSSQCKGGWVGMFTRLFLCHSPCPTSPHNNTLHKRVLSKFALMDALYHMFIFCHNLTCIAVMNTLFKYFVNNGIHYPLVWFHLAHALEFNHQPFCSYAKCIYLVHYMYEVLIVGDAPNTLNQWICIKCHNHSTLLH